MKARIIRAHFLKVTSYRGDYLCCWFIFQSAGCERSGLLVLLRLIFIGLRQVPPSHDPHADSAQLLIKAAGCWHKKGGKYGHEMMQVF